MSTPPQKPITGPIETIPALHDQAANKIIRNYTLAATASGLIPFSILAAASLTSTQVLMVRKLCRLFQVPFSPKRAQVILNSVLGSAATSLIAVATASVPGINSSMKGLTNAALSSLYTATVGEFYKVHFQSGGNLENASISDLSKYFIEEYKRGDISFKSMTNPVHTIKEVMN